MALLFWECICSGPAPNFLPSPERYFYNPDADLQLLRKNLRSERREIIAANMVLTDAQEKTFWPVYTRYEAELVRIYDKKVAFIEQFSRDQDTESYFKGRAGVEDSIMQLRLRYIPIFRTVLSAGETASLFRIDWRLCQLVDLQREPMPLTQSL